MITKTITWNDLDGNSCTDNFYFNFTQFELMELQVSRKGGFAESIAYLSKGGHDKEELEVIKEILLKAYGRRSDDRREFIKEEAHAAAFSHSEAFSVLFMDLFQNEAKANAFFNELIPAGAVEQAEEAILQQQGVQSRPTPQDYRRKEPTAPAHKAEIASDNEKVIELPSEHHPLMSLQSFQALAAEDQERFIKEGGKLDAEL